MLKGVWAHSVFKKKIAKHTCSHSEKIPEKLTRSMQCNVTWQTSSEYRRLTVPSGRTLNHISFVRKIQIPEIFGSPLVCVIFRPSHRSGQTPLLQAGFSINTEEKPGTSRNKNYKVCSLKKTCLWKTRLEVRYNHAPRVRIECSLSQSKAFDRLHKMPFCNNRKTLLPCQTGCAMRTFPNAFAVSLDTSNG
jgi:hypothetical protein